MHSAPTASHVDVKIILRRLACGDSRCECQRSIERGHGRTHFPCHSDARPSLNISIARDGMILLKCHAGCRNRDVIRALQDRGLWPRREQAERRETRYELRSADGRLLATHVRLDSPEGKRIWWELPDGCRGLGGMRVEDLPLYGLDRLGEAEQVILVEGEKAAEALIRLGLPAVGTVTGASATPSHQSLQPLAHRAVWIWPDNDNPGRDHMRRIAERLAALGCARIYVVEWPEAPQGGDAADFVAQGGTAEDVKRLLTSAQPWDSVCSADTEQSIEHKVQKGAGSFRFAHMSDLLAEPEEQVAWLVEGLLPSGGISLLAAKPKVGKSTTARCLALSVARGEPFLGRATAKGSVVYLALEEKRAEIVKHFRRQGATESDAVYVHVGIAPQNALDELAAVIVDLQPALIIVDPLLKLVRLRDVNDYAEVSRALEPIIDLARQTGTHIMLVHHLNKGAQAGGDAILGSTAIFGAVDTAVVMRRHQDGTRTLETIQRYGEDLPESVIVLDTQTGTVELAGTVSERKLAEAQAAVLQVVKDAPLTEAEIREATQMQATLIARAIRTLVEQGALIRSGSGKRGDPYRYALRDCSTSSTSSTNSTSSTSSTSSTQSAESSTSSTQTGPVEKSPRHDAENRGKNFSPPATPESVVGGEKAWNVSGNGSTPRCPSCRQPYELRSTDRPDWWQLKCRCTGGAWHWVRANDPALRGAHP